MIYAKIYVRPPEFMGWSLKLRLSYIRIYLHFLNRKEEKTMLQTETVHHLAYVNGDLPGF